MKKTKDISGNKYNHLTVIKIMGRDSTNKITWQCQCDCGNITTVTGLNLKNGTSKSCGCLKHKQRYNDLVGLRFGRLVVMEIYKIKNEIVFWNCVCDCGKNNIVTTGHLKSGHTQSCGCLMREKSREKAYKNLSGKKENHPRWNKKLTDDDRKYRRNNTWLLKKWAESVYLRDSYTCIKCGSPDKIQAHHLYSFSRVKERQFDISNGVSLCKKCHREFHSIYGITKFYRSDFFNYIGLPDPGDFTILKIDDRTKFYFNLLKNAGEKDKSKEIEDLKKAIKYIEFEIERLEKL